MSTLAWRDVGTQTGTLLQAHCRRHYVGYVHKYDNYVRWEWGFRDGARWIRGDCRRKSDAVRRVEANWQRFLVRAGLEPCREPLD